MYPSKKLGLCNVSRCRLSGDISQLENFVKTNFNFFEVVYKTPP